MSASDKIALTSVIASGAVGLAAVLVAGLGGWRDRVATRRLAQEERRQTRLGDTYVDLLDLAERVGHWVTELRPVTAGDEFEAPTPPSIAEQTKVQAKLAAFGSADVKNLHSAWFAVVRDITTADNLVRLRLRDSKEHARYDGRQGEASSRNDPTEPWAKIHEEYLPAERKAREALIAGVAAELSDRPRAARRWARRRSTRDRAGAAS